ncbi:hypothetical protein HD553DRAFT_353932 [Filobasidium floriforme]|uniref:uncharacterized protein n=1 Tax=Filobasidium floriforme TaxID=5210 RepID=UPI001E8E7914|nr:uncharacterized protein HD553DRAFT_353932 [Filobasidium floriforme]KAH8090505.1 hypothetical protein HD553DRAFT_353932 [Filobasidium floriforme]
MSVAAPREADLNKGWKRGPENFAFADSDSDDDDDNETGDGNLDLSTREDPAKPPPPVKVSKRRKLDTKTGTKASNGTNTGNASKLNNNRSNGNPRGWQSNLPFVPLTRPQAASDSRSTTKSPSGPMDLGRTDLDNSGVAGPSSSSSLNSNSTWNSNPNGMQKKGKMKVLGPNHNTTGTRKTSIQQKISSFATPIPHAPALPIHDSKNKNSMTSKTSDRVDKGKVPAVQDAGGAGSGARTAGGTKVTDAGSGITFGTLPNLKTDAAKKFPIVMGFERQKTLPTRQPASALIESRQRQTGSSATLTAGKEARSESEGEVVYIGHAGRRNGMATSGRETAGIDGPTGSQKLQRYKLDMAGVQDQTAGIVQGDGRGPASVDEYPEDQPGPIFETVEDHGNAAPSAHHMDDLRETHLDEARGCSTAFEDMQVSHNDIYETRRIIGKRTPIIPRLQSKTPSNFVHDLEAEGFYDPQPNLRNPLPSRSAYKSPHHSTPKPTAYPATPRRTIEQHRQLLQEVPSARPAVPDHLIARRAFEAAKVKNGSEEETGTGTSYVDDEEFASIDETWTTLPSRRSNSLSKSSVPIKTAAKFSLPGGLFGKKNRQPNPTLFSGPANPPPRSNVHKRSSNLPGTTSIQATTRKITMFHPSPRPDAFQETPSSPSPSPSFTVRPLHAQYVASTIEPETSLGELPLTTRISAVLLQPTYLNPLEPGHLRVDLDSLKTGYADVRRRIAESHRAYARQPELPNATEGYIATL